MPSLSRFPERRPSAPWRGRGGWLAWLAAILAAPLLGAPISRGVERERSVEDTLLDWCSPSLRELRRRETALEGSLEALGTPLVGQTVAEFGYQSPRLSAPPVSPLWVQLDLGARQKIDRIALVPAQVDWQPLERPSYGFPRRFRVDISDDPDFHEFSTLADFTDADFEEPGIAPVSVRAAAVSARYVRLTVTKPAVQNGQFFFALAEFMVLDGNRDIAIGCRVRSSATFNSFPRWAEGNLVDGWTPLGPPIRRELLPYDGLYADAAPGPQLPGPQLPWLQVDLGGEYDLQEVRLHPVHARLGADVPGFDFPSQFRLLASQDPDFSNPTVLLEAVNQPFSKPGNNPIIVPARQARARYVRLQSLKEQRIGLSEMEIYSEGRNVARNGTVQSSPDRSSFSGSWPRALLVDGFTSYGRLMEWPEWLDWWERRSALHRTLAEIADQRPAVEAAARRRLGWMTGLATAGGACLAAGAILRGRRRRTLELRQMRLSLARDLHDEIGSNLAALALLSEYAVDQGAGKEQGEDWLEVNRIARETTDSMREVLWLMGGRAESGIDLGSHLQLAAKRILPGVEIEWRHVPDIPASLEINARRQIFLFFKEALANVARHAGASKVMLSAGTDDGVFYLEIRDNGCGFANVNGEAGMGLPSLRERAKALGGRAVTETCPEGGARVALVLPLVA